jgi:TrpR-related protein YerC/YecD
MVTTKKIKTSEPKEEIKALSEAQRQKNLVKAFTLLKGDKSMANFVYDIFTPAEIDEFSNRLEISRLLTKKLSYQKIAAQVGTSTTTVTRVARWLNKGRGGYVEVLKSMAEETKSK